MTDVKKYRTRDCNTTINFNGEQVNLEGILYGGFPGIEVRATPDNKSGGGIYIDKDDQSPGLVTVKKAEVPSGYVAFDGNVIYDQKIQKIRFLGHVRGTDPCFESCSMEDVLTRTQPELKTGYNAVYGIPSMKVVRNAAGNPLKDSMGRNYSSVFVTDRITKEE